MKNRRFFPRSAGLWAASGILAGCAVLFAFPPPRSQHIGQSLPPNPNQNTFREPVTEPVNSTLPPGLRYLALGDSYTIGEKVKISERFPAQLVRRLRQRGIQIDDPLIIAQTGWTAAELSDGISAATPSGHFDLVTLLVGVNNQYRGLSQNEYRTQLRSLIYRAIEFGGGEEKRVLLISIPDWGVTPFARNFNRALIAEQIDAFNRVNHAEASAASVRYVDITARSREAAQDENCFAADGLHPSGLQYANWVDGIFPEALAALGR